MSVCFTNGEGPARIGSPCALPFSFQGKLHTTCASVSESPPLGLDVAPGVTFPSTWCATVPVYNASVSSSWGFCGSCMTQNVFDSLPGSSGTGKKFTLSGCVCLDQWKLPGYEPCKSACCAPDADERAWCLSEDPSCEGTGWGYCKDPPTLQASGLPERTWFDNITFVADVTHSPTPGQASGAPTGIEPTNEPTITGMPTSIAPSTAGSSSAPVTSVPTVDSVTSSPSAQQPSSTDTPSLGGSQAPTFNEQSKTSIPSTNAPFTGQPSPTTDDQVPIILLTLFLISVFAAAAIVATRRFISMYEDREEKKQSGDESAEAPDTGGVKSNDEAQLPKQRKSLIQRFAGACKTWMRPKEKKGSSPNQKASEPSEDNQTSGDEVNPEIASGSSWSQRLRVTAEKGKQRLSKIYARTTQGLQDLVEKTFPKPETPETPKPKQEPSEENSSNTFAADQT